MDAVQSRTSRLRAGGCRQAAKLGSQRSSPGPFFPEVISMLTRDVQWTTDLGNAFLAQQGDVMDAIQQLRAAARRNGRLSDTAQQRVTVEQDNGQSAIEIVHRPPGSLSACLRS